MYKIKTNLDVNGRGWGLDFEHGVAYTERDDLARRLKSLGYEVEKQEQKAELPAVIETVNTNPPESTDAETTDPVKNDVGKFICSICGKECGSQAVLTRHMNKEHAEHA